MRDTTDLPTWTIGERMAKARGYAGMSQAELAAAMGVSRRSITRHETSDDPPRAIVLAYSAATGVPVWWLEGEAPPEPGNAQAADRRAPRSTKWGTTVRLRLAA